LPSQSPTQNCGTGVSVVGTSGVCVRVGTRLVVIVGVPLPGEAVAVAFRVGVMVRVMVIVGVGRPGIVEVGIGVNDRIGVNVRTGVKLSMGVKLRIGVNV
jgi:hypothetical protein